ncbi:GrlR family regulatory protein [Acinetobacter gyllenbergii]|uniref:GrlR family regulatory protein n=1 Tax=Acinetobacter gyllenbergii TaxID=134534 RepID=UPI003F569069
MNNGIYFVNFRSNIADFGSGTVVVNNEVVNGGDYGFAYKGRIEGDNLTLRVSQHDSNVVSVMGGMGDFDLFLKIQPTGYGYHLEGETPIAPNVRIMGEAKFIGDLLV